MMSDNMQIFGIIVIGAIVIYLYSQREKKKIEPPKPVGRPEWSNWGVGWRCPSCNRWTSTQRKVLGEVVCKDCGGLAEDYVRIKYRKRLQNYSDGSWKSIDRIVANLKKSEQKSMEKIQRVVLCDYCGRDPCGCGATK
jgi:hypothetical protein